MLVSCLTTFDNPFDPFDDFVRWWKQDTEVLHHYCAAQVARIVRESDSLTEEEQNEENERAIDQIVSEDTENIYYKISKEIP